MDSDVGGKGIAVDLNLHYGLFDAFHDWDGPDIRGYGPQSRGKQSCGNEPCP